MLNQTQFYILYILIRVNKIIGIYIYNYTVTYLHNNCINTQTDQSY